MKKQITSLLTGALTLALALTMTTTALAAPGGTAQSAAQKGAAQTQAVQTSRQWQRTWEGNRIRYTSPVPAEGVHFSGPPDWRLTAVPEGWKLDGVHVTGIGGNCTWIYRKGANSLKFSCWYPHSGQIGTMLRTETDAASVYHRAAVNGASADFYQDEDEGILVWENGEGMLFRLEAPLSQTELETLAAAAAQTQAEALPVYQLGWVPEGSASSSRSTLREAVREGWTGPDKVSFGWIYAAASAGALAEPEGTPETVKVKGVQAKYWEGDPKAEGCLTVSVGSGDASMQKVLEIPAENQLSTLLWTDAATGVSFRIQGKMDKATLLHMAESVK